MKATILIKSRTLTSHCIRTNYIPLTLSWRCTVHKYQGLSMDKEIIELNLHKQAL